MRNKQREIIVYKNYFYDFFNDLTIDEKRKVYYVFDVVKMQERVSSKFVKHITQGLFEMRIEYNRNIYRIFFVFRENDIVVLFNGFQKKTQKNT